MKKYLLILLINFLFSQSEEIPSKVHNVSLVATSNVFAEYYDCGCPKAPLGGLARKTFFFKNMMSEREPLLVDAGNTFFSHGVINPDGLKKDQKKYKAKNFVDVLELIGYDVVNIGSNDFKLGASYLREITSNSSINFISANLVDRKTNQLLFEPYHTLEEDGVKIAFIGLSEATRFESIINKNFILEGNKYIDLLESKVDLIVLLVDLSSSNAIDLSSAFDRADYIFLSGVTKRTEPRSKQAQQGPLVYSTGIQGKHLSIVDIRIKDISKEIEDVSAPFSRLQEIDYRLKRMQAKDPSKKIEEIYANDPNVLTLVTKYQKEAFELGQSLAKYGDRSIFFSVPLSPTIPDDRDVSALIKKIAGDADFSFEKP
tara:strand:- start:17 stop:1132 length:1116 start_codon:yes stop_codon:yes gene_type:complete